MISRQIMASSIELSGMHSFIYSNNEIISHFFLNTFRIKRLVSLKLLLFVFIDSEVARRMERRL